MKTRGIVRPEIVIPVTAHAAFDKAADWLQLEIRKVPIDPKTMKVDTRKMRKMMSRNVVMVWIHLPKTVQLDFDRGYPALVAARS